MKLEFGLARQILTVGLIIGRAGKGIPEAFRSHFTHCRNYLNG
jgi:hypothetical protein